MPRAPASGRISRTVLSLLILLALGRIVSTYGVLTQVHDEPAHLATGLEWIDRGTYELEHLHPPLGRIAIALGPFLDGARLDGGGDPNFYKVGNRILHEGDRYVRRLSLARAGVIPFFIAAAVIVFLWARAASGLMGALFATAAFTTLPPVLAHAGLATTDMPAVAGYGAAVFTFLHWLRKPGYPAALLFGTVGGLGILTKFSVPAFLLPCLAVIGCVHLFQARGDGSRVQPRCYAYTALLAAAVGFIVVWGAYRFSVRPLTTPEHRPHETLIRVTGSSGPLHRAGNSLLEANVWPATEFVRGIRDVAAKNRRGHAYYLFGRRLHHDGVWYFFPALLMVKSPVPFLILVLLGLVLAGRRLGWGSRIDRHVGAALIAVVTILAVAMASNINLGVRHVLPIFVPLSVLAGYAAARLWKSSHRLALRAGLPLACIGIQMLAGLAAHPDYLSFFNSVASSVWRPEQIAVDSDLDWGQDMGRLVQYARARGIDHIQTACHGSFPTARVDRPSLESLPPDSIPAGWVAVSVTKARAMDGYSWVRRHAPVTRVGTSIHLYYIPTESAAQPPNEYFTTAADAR